MATLRKITLNWEIRTGAITCDTGYIKRQELCDVDLYVTVDGTPYALDTSWALNLSIKPALLGDNAALVAVTTWTASATTGLYQATAQTIGGTALDTYLAANNADTTDDEGNKLVDLDVYYTVSMAMRAKSDTVTVICKPDVGRADDTVPATIIARNDFLVSNGTGLLVNVAAGYAANGAFVAAQASLAITNATNYIEATAAGVASVNTTAFTAGSYPLATVVASAGAITANTDLRAWITPKPATSTGLTVGITAIASGTSGRILYDNAGVLGELPVGTGVATALAVNVGSAGAFITFNGDAGTPSALVGTNISGTASGLTAGNVTTNANLTGHVTSTGNAAVLGSFTFAQLNTAVSDADVARTSGTNTFTGVQSMTSPDITTSITTPSTTFALVNATASTVNFAGGASTALNMGHASGTNTVLGFNVLSTAGAASKPVLKVSGVPFAGTGTTSFPLVYINDANATASTTLNTAGTYFGVNGDGTQDLMNLLKDGTSMCKVSSIGKLTAADVIQAGTSSVTAPGFTLAGGNNGLFTSAGSRIGIANAGVASGEFASATPGIRIPSNGAVYFTDGAFNTFSNLVCTISRNADGILQVGTTAANALGSLLLTNLTANGTLAVTGATTLTGLLTANGGITLGDAQNIAFNTTTGTKIGAATTQKLSFWNATPIVQPTTAVASATVVHLGAGTNLKTDDTFDGYTLAQVVKALRNAGLLA